MDATATLMARYAEAGEERDYAVIDGIAVIPVQGTLLKKASFMSAWSGRPPTSRSSARWPAPSMTRVRAILLDIDSPGGETAGCFELCDYIYSIRGAKPVYAAANDIALSAAYAIACAASKIFVTRTGAVGSIGVYALHVDQSAFDKELGAKYTYVFAGDRKVDGNPHEPLSERAMSDIQGEVDREYGIFTGDGGAQSQGMQREDRRDPGGAVLGGQRAAHAGRSGWHFGRRHERAAPGTGRRDRNSHGGEGRNSHERSTSNGTDRTRGRRREEGRRVRG